MIAIDNVNNRRFYSDYLIVDISHTYSICRFSPYYPHGEIPIPLSLGVCGNSVFDVWNTLRIIENSSNKG